MKEIRQSQIFQNLQQIKSSPSNSPYSSQKKKIKQKCRCSTCQANFECLQKYKKIQQQLMQLQNNNGILNRKIVNQLYNIKYLSKQSIKLGKRILELQNVIDEKDKQVQQLNGKIQEYVNQIISLQLKQTQKQNYIQQLQTLTAAKDSENLRFRQQLQIIIQNKDKQITTLQQKLQESRKKYLIIQCSPDSSKIQSGNINFQKGLEKIKEEQPIQTQGFNMISGFKSEIIQQERQSRPQRIFLENRRGRYIQQDLQTQILQQILKQVDKKNLQKQQDVEKSLQKHFINFLLQQNGKITFIEQKERKKLLEVQILNQKQRIISEIKLLNLNVNLVSETHYKKLKNRSPLNNNTQNKWNGFKIISNLFYK